MNIYEGTENYIFVSYAHADSDRVMPILEALDREGLRLWYDSGIEVGSEWPAYIAARVKGCYRMIYFVTENSVSSKNCRNEVNLALSKNKEIIVAYLEDAELQYGLDLQLSTNQAIYKSRCQSDTKFIESIVRAKMFQPCKEEKSAPIYVAPPAMEKTSAGSIFIGYRREGGETVARLVNDTLRNRGYRTFFEMDSLRAGAFPQDIVSQLKDCDNYILILPPNALDRCKKEKDWLRKEIAIAISLKKNIIPIMLPGFIFPGDLPAEIADISRYNGVQFVMTFFDAVIGNIIGRLV